MPISSIANNIKHHIFLEFLTISRSNPRSLHNCFYIITIYVKNRRINHFRQIRSINSTSRVSRIRSKSNLVVNNNMNHPSSIITLRAIHNQILSNNALPSKSRITVNQNPKRLRSSLVTKLILASTNSPSHNRIHSL